MSLEMFVFDEPYYQQLDPEMLSPEISSNFFTDPLSNFSDSSIDSILQELSSDDQPNPSRNNATTTKTNSFSSQISTDEVQSFDQLAHTLFSNSPPSHQLETLSLTQQQTQLCNLQQNSCTLASAYSHQYPLADIKTEEFIGFDSPNYDHHNNSFFLGVPNSYSGGESLVKYLQKSYSSSSFEGKPASNAFYFQPSFNSVIEGQTLMGSPEIDSNLTDGQMRRACSTGDLPEVRMNQAAAQQNIEGNYTEESNFKVGRYSAEERKERIDRYRAKRTQRNFNKTIKYACRKTLADNRPRIRGRFARNDETGEIPKPTCYNRYEDEDDLWVDNLQEEEDQEGILGRGGRFMTNFGGTHLQYCGY